MSLTLRIPEKINNNKNLTRLRTNEEAPNIANHIDYIPAL